MNLKTIAILTAIVLFTFLAAGCSATRYHERTDEKTYDIIARKQKQALGKIEPFTIEPPSEQLRRRLLLHQKLPVTGPSSYGSTHLSPIEHWPEESKNNRPIETEKLLPLQPNDEILSISLLDALQIGAHNSPEYQSRKEDVFRSALDLDFERDKFRHTFAGQISGSYSQDRSNADAAGGITSGLENSSFAEVSRTFLNGMTMTAKIGLDLARMLQPSRVFSRSVFGDASISIPLLRGAGTHIAGEPLTQAERNAVYAIWDFERYKKEFAVKIADSYLSVLQAADQITNQEENYRGLIASTRRAERLAEAGKTPQIQVDQSLQNELRARDRWITARQLYEQQLDGFKIFLGLPTDSKVLLDRSEFDNLKNHINKQLSHLLNKDGTPRLSPADSPIVLSPPDKKERGPLEIDSSTAVNTALSKRLDMQILSGRVYDAQRKVVVAADALRPELTLLGTAAYGEHRNIATARLADSDNLDFSQGIYEGLLTLDLPLERTAEANAYRNSFINLERAIREVQKLEDQIKLQVRNTLRNLEQARASIKVQYQAVKLAERRVKGAALFLEAGRAEIRDLLEARESLLTAQNSLTSAMVNYRIAELELQRDTGVLQTDSRDLWENVSPAQEKE